MYKSKISSVYTFVSYGARDNWLTLQCKLPPSRHGVKYHFNSYAPATFHVSDCSRCNYVRVAEGLSSAQIPRVVSFQIFSLKTAISLLYPLNHTFNEMHGCQDYRWKTRATLRVGTYIGTRWFIPVAPALIHQLRHIRERFNWLACLIYNRAEFYAVLAALSAPRFSFLTLTYRSRASTWSTWKWTSALKNIGAHLVSFERSFGFPPSRPIQLNSATVDAVPWNKPFGSRSVNRPYLSPSFFPII